MMNDARCHYGALPETMIYLYKLFNGWVHAKPKMQRSRTMFILKNEKSYNSSNISSKPYGDLFIHEKSVGSG